MGYSTRLFSSRPTDGVMCIICFEVMEDAVSMKECGHTFCEGCITQVLQLPGFNKKCPNCRVVVTGTNPNYSLRDVVESMPFKCPQDACNWRGLVKDLRRHEGVCPFTTITCAVAGCGHECKRKDMDAHNASTQGIVKHMELRYEHKMRDMEQKYDAKVAEVESKMEKRVKQLESNMRLETNHMRYANLCSGWIEHKRKDSGREYDFDVFQITRLDVSGHPISGLLCRIESQGAAYPMVVRYESVYGPPTCKFPRGFFHINVCPDGAFRSQDFGWRAETALSDILLDVQQILLHPRPGLIRQQKAGDLFGEGEGGTWAYTARARKEAGKYPPLYRHEICNHSKLNEMLGEGESVSAWAHDHSENIWVQCEACDKWRMLPPDMSDEEVRNLPEQWYCKDNIHDPARSTCEAEERGAVWMRPFYERRAKRETDRWRVIGRG